MTKNEAVTAIYIDLLARYPDLSPCGEDILAACALLEAGFRSGKKLLLCGNGGSASDAEHIVGELMKGFKKKRPVDPALFAPLSDREKADFLASNLQGALPAVALTGGGALPTAFANDVSPALVFAQQVFGMGGEGDMLLGISTSGNAQNVEYAVRTAKALGMKTVGLTGRAGGGLAALCDVTIRVPADETYLVQELHLPVYHALCAMLEEAFFN